jgi:hypothetical protein
MFVMLVPLLAIVLISNWRAVLWSAPLALLPFGIFALIMVVIAPQTFLFDLHFVLSRLNQIPLSQQAAVLGQNFTTLVGQDGWMLFGAIGLVLLRPPRLRWISAAVFAIPIVLLGRTTALFSLSFYYLIPLLPFVVLGAAALIRYGVSWTAGRLGQRTSRPAAAALSMLVAAAMLFSAIRLVEQVRNGFNTDIDGFLLDPLAARAASAFVNQRAASDDLVIASPTLAWMLQAKAADMQMPIAYRGQATPHLPANVSRERWAFDPSVKRARYVIVDNLWRNWAVPNVPGVIDMLQEIEVWPIVFRSGEVVVYQNPEE